jgi:hypothetical protein
MRLAAEDYETDKIVFEVRALIKPQSALREPGLAARAMATIAGAPACQAFFPPRRTSGSRVRL